MHYFVGDIHGYFTRLTTLMDKLKGRMQKGDTLVFLGDYIDRGPKSYEVIDFLISLSKIDRFHTVFLKGNHEDMMLSYFRGEDENNMYLFNGGDKTVKSYKKNYGSFKLPSHHKDFFANLKLYYEGDDFIAVHAGLNPMVDSPSAQDEFDLLWIREKFYHGDRRWKKTVIFGHTPVSYLKRDKGIYRDERRNIIGIDTGVIYGNPLSCLEWPSQEVITG